MSFTTPIVIAGHTFSPLIAGLIVLCTLMLIGSVTGYLRRRLRYNLEARYHAALATWTTEFSATAAVDQALRNDRYGLVNGQRSFTGASKDKLDSARKDWSSWSAQRFVAERTKKEAEELFAKFENRKWWQISHKPLKTAIHKLTDRDVEVDSSCLSGSALPNLAGLAPTATIKGEQLIADMQSAGANVRSVLEQIQSAVKRAADSESRFRETVSGSAKDSLSDLKTRLAATKELPFDPYDARFTDINQQLGQFSTQANGDPLTDYSSLEASLRGKVTRLRDDLNKALELFKALLAYRKSLFIQSEKVAEQRRTPLRPGFPDAIIEDASAQTGSMMTFRFAEDDEQLDRLLQSAATASTNLTELLVAGKAGDFQRVLPTAQADVAGAAAIVEEVLAAKAFVDTEMSTIVFASTRADLEADLEDTTAICTLYTAQKWRAARVSAAVLLALHKQRVNARAAVDDMQSKLAESQNALDRRPFIFSPGVDSFCVDVQTESRRLKEVSQLGRTDWQSLVEQISSLVLEICGETPSSLAQRIQQETREYDQALTSVRALGDKLADLKAKSGDRWGGAQAAEMLAGNVPSVTGVMTQCEVAKQNWTALHQQAVQVLEQLKPAEALISNELAGDARVFELLTQVEADIEGCQATSYRREVNGVDYGAGIHCNTTAARQLFQAAYEAYQSRHYEETHRDADLAVAVLLRAHLESWWLCLQMMSMSDDFAARQFALQQGYVDYGFDYWMRCRVTESAQPIGGKPAAVTVRYSVPSAFGAATNKAKAAHAVSFGLPGDSPALTDYERSYAAKL